MTDPTIPPGPSALLAFVRPERGRGPILLATGEFLTEVRDGCASWDIGDYDMPMPDRPGLLVFEGWIEVNAGPDPDVSFRGSWRQLTHWEMCRVRFGLSPFGDENA